jgi:DNA-binding IclR family transcriptional regulator
MRPRGHRRSLEKITGRGSAIQVVDRLTRILELFAASGREMRVREIALTLKLQRSTVHRYLASLSRAGFLRAIDGGSYSLGPLLIQLGAAAVAGVHVVNLAENYLYQLCAEAQETAVLSLWAGHCPVVVRVREPADKLVQIHIRLGSLLPLDSAQGHVFLAHSPDHAQVRDLLLHLPEGQRREFEREMEQVRRHGVWINSRVAEGIRAIAVPVFDHEVIACTLAFVGTLASIPADFDSGLVEVLKDAAQKLSRELGQARQAKPATPASPAELAASGGSGDGSRGHGGSTR